MSDPDTLELLSDIHDYDKIIAEGIASTVSCIPARLGDLETSVIVKKATTNKRFSPEPHDILKELRILDRCAHDNVVTFLGYDCEDGTVEDPETVCLYLEFVQIPLTTVLASPKFSPHPFPPGSDATNRQGFEVVAKSILFQTLSALAYLHTDEIGVSHRDVKPSNIHINSSGLVKLIDFGVSYDALDTSDSEPQNVWPEPADRMYFEVSTGPYRAPELLFGTRAYDPHALDMWSFGCTMAEFFTPLILESDDDDFSDEEDNDGDEQTQPFMVPKRLRGQIGHPGTHWIRGNLFNGSRGELGLIWSIFKIRGTPTVDTWPTFKELPDAKSVDFNQVSTVDLTTLLPNLPSSSIYQSSDEHFPPDNASPTAADLFHRFLVYPPERRLKAEAARRHPWFASETESVLFPEGYEVGDGVKVNVEVQTEDGKPLADYLQSIL